MSSKKVSDAKSAQVAPDARPLTQRQADRLAQLSGLNAAELVKRPVAEIADRYKWRIDPDLLFFRRVCGRVVKTDPVTGIDYPVPYATVYVEDTDCNFIGWFPESSPWGWLYPVFCSREEIATVKADACGNFCVWIPRFDIDWILRWRAQWVCYPEIFIKPSIRDLLDHLAEQPVRVIPHGPDPGPEAIRDFSGDVTPLLQRAQGLLGAPRAQRLAAAINSLQLSGRTAQVQELLDRPAALNMPPPSVEKLRNLHKTYAREGAKALAEHFGVDAARVEGFDPSRYVGPLPRWYCRYEIRPELVPVFDVPDITFRVTQDVDGDGVEETIYSEGYFDVRWNAGNIPDVTLHASAIAVASPFCGDIPDPNCESLDGGVGIAQAGFVPLAPVAPTAPNSPPLNGQYFDPNTGYGIRPNRPHLVNAVDAAGNLRTSATTDPSATAPFQGTLLLCGCNQAEGAAYYRVKYKSAGGGGSHVPFQNVTWPIFRPLSNIPNWVVPDANGWYPILPDPGNWMIPYLLFSWPTGLPDTYSVLIELADSAKNSLLESAPVLFNVDNTGPSGSLQLAWRVAQNNTLSCSDASWTPLSSACPIVRRPHGADIEFCVSYTASSLHLGFAKLYASGCGSASSVLTLRTGGASVAHWYTAESDNTVMNSAIFRLAYASDNQGAYSFGLHAYSRAFNPTDATGYTLDWNNYDQMQIGGYIAGVQVAVIDA